MNHSSRFSVSATAEDAGAQAVSHSLIADDPENLVSVEFEDIAGLKEVCACIALFLVSSVPATLYQTPRQRPMPIQRLEDGEVVVNLTNNETFDGETISDFLLIVLAALLPLFLQLILGKFVLRSVGDIMATICTYAVAVGLTNVVTFSLKLYCGYLRPSFFQQCRPNNDFSDCSVSDDSNSRMSFPSGHASLSFCGLMLLSRFIQVRFGVASSKRPSSRHRLISLLSLAPLGLATFIASSRVVDNRHFPADIVAGSLLGASLAAFVHGIWFVGH